jgi:DNA-binding NtrC family response regulator
VFLDEIGELDLAIQVKLLRVVQQRTYTRLGDSTERAFAGKIIAATNRDLAEEIDAGRFRHDLYYRLCADRIETPSLSEQLADRPQALASLIHFIAERVAPGEASAVAAEAEGWITANMPAGYPWPGNIRELEQCVRNILVRREYTPRSGPAIHRTGWLADAEAGKLTADELLSAYATWLYSRLGTYEATATKLGLDRRTVKSKINAKLLESIRRG